MATILQFKMVETTSMSTEDDEGRALTSADEIATGGPAYRSAEIIPFPGVRYSRGDTEGLESEADTSANERHERDWLTLLV